jgi:hypothetical protein
MRKGTTYVGLDVHKETIAVAVAEGEGGEVRSLGLIPNRSEAGGTPWTSEGLGGVRSRAVRVHGVPLPDAAGRALRGGGSVPDPDETWGPGEDGPAGCGQAGPSAAQWRTDAGVGAGRRA